MQKEKLNTEPMPAADDSLDFINATGPIAVTLRNDMLFHSVMQHSNESLKALVCALKGLDPETVKEVVLTNPIDYSANTHKVIILDVKVLLNNAEILDVELQLYSDKYWEQRSILYLCRSFDSIGDSEKYKDLKPTTTIAIMDDPLFPEHPEFYSKYQLLNLENHQPYSTMINLNVLYLNMTDLATNADKENNLVYWAELFKTTTWEHLKELCESHPIFKEVAKVMYEANTKDYERSLYEAHQRFLLDQRSAMADSYDEGEENGYARGIKEGEEERQALIAKNNALEAEIASLRKLLDTTK